MRGMFIPNLAHAIQHMDIVAIYEALYVKGQNRREETGVLIPRIKNAKSVYLVTYEVNLLSVAECKESPERVARIALTCSRDS